LDEISYHSIQPSNINGRHIIEEEETDEDYEVKIISPTKEAQT
jgi:hypothetical protein